MEKKTITIKEVAEYANVSQATVSRVINGQASVKEKNLVKVQQAIEALGYTPNLAAQALASSRSNSVGMLVGSLDGPFYGPLMHSAEDELYRAGLHFIVTSGQESEVKERDALNFLRSKQVDGAIVHSDKLSDDELKQFAHGFKALVVLNRFIPELDHQCLSLDNELGGYLATKNLLDNGHRHIACITGPLSKPDARDRLSGYIRALAEHNVAYDPRLTIEGRFDHEGNFVKAYDLLANAGTITAVFCQNDNIALAVYDACAKLNLTIGEDISLVSFDNDLMSSHMRPRLSTVGFPIYEMGKLAGKMIIDQLHEKQTLTSRKLVPQLVERDSVKNLNA
ncbi:LacI family transcriptional regulator [Vibrio sp. SM6]|uniref:LacI family transcriptional regulator n=1 Tax=Vibrio agarilyticus TaxID=2726741 RepID=A0A7X8TTL6_9VIBR|nr:LacI family DNA-binding transcriptional regulator [Vibrio agarilyticus]NLS14068.1 LacI family transcriptional regulator [Vibrio agarilyticus]